MCSKVQIIFVMIVKYKELYVFLNVLFTYNATI